MNRKQAEQLARFLDYLLGRRPDEFGLVPDAGGFLPVADVLKVVQEEGWPHVRRNHLETLNFHLERPVIEHRKHLVRACERSRLADLQSAAGQPKLLFAPIRRRAYHAVARHGLRAQGHVDRVVLFTRRDLARKVGGRRDAEPVLVTVNVAEAQARGCVLQPYGATLYLADGVPPSACRLPRAPRARETREKDSSAVPTAPRTPGSFMLDPRPVSGTTSGELPSKGRARPKDWKRQRQKARRWKQERGRS